MTGEVSLTGRVLPIGEKKQSCSLVRAGVTTVLIPKRNEPDLEDVPENVRGAAVGAQVLELASRAREQRGWAQHQGRSVAA